MIQYAEIYVAFSLVCFFVAIIFYRKEDVPFNKVFFLFMASMLSPIKMKEYFKIEGLGFILMGYVSFIVFMVMFVMS